MLCSIKHRERRLKIDTFPTRNRQIIHIGSTSVIKHCRWCGSGKETKGLLFSCFTTDRHAFSAVLYLVAYFYEWSWYCNWCEAKTVFFIYPLAAECCPAIFIVFVWHICVRDGLRKRSGAITNWLRVNVNCMMMAPHPTTKRAGSKSSISLFFETQSMLRELLKLWDLLYHQLGPFPNLD